jgi:hypothetical protein
MNKLTVCSIGPEPYHYCENNTDPSKLPKHSGEPLSITTVLIFPRSDAHDATVGIFIAP